MSAHTPTPWRANCFQVLGGDGSRVAHTGMGQLPPTRSQEAVENADIIARAVNSHDALMAALELAKVDLDAARIFVECHEEAPALGIRQTLEKIDAALVAAKAVQS